MGRRLKFKQSLEARGYPENIIERCLSGVSFASWQSAFKHTQKPKGHERLLPFVTTYHPAVKNLKQILMEQWSLIHNQPLLKIDFTKPPIFFYEKRKSLQNMLVRAKNIIQKAVMRRDHESHTGSPYWSIFTFILTSCRCDLSLVSTFFSSLLSILLRRKTYF